MYGYSEPYYHLEMEILLTLSICGQLRTQIIMQEVSLNQRSATSE